METRSPRDSLPGVTGSSIHLSGSRSLAAKVGMLIGVSASLRRRCHRAHGATVIWLSLIAALAVPPVFADTVSLGAGGIQLQISEGWSHKTHANITKIYNVTSDRLASAPGALTGAVQVSVHTEALPDHAAAVQALRVIAAESGATPSYLAITGWPALQRRFMAPKPRGQASTVDENVWMITTAVAVDNVLVRIEGWAPEASSEATLSDVEAIGLSLSTSSAGSAPQVDQELQELKLDPKKGLPTLSPSTDGAPSGSEALAAFSVEALVGAEAVEAAPGTTTRVTNQGGRDSELEIAVADGGLDIVIGSNNSFSFSSDGGRTWNPSANVGSNDPSVTWGPSGGPQGTFYAANIASPSTGFWTSTDGGANFVRGTNAYTCGQGGDPACGAAFPDQEHIVADRFNQTAGGDQIYDVWRHLDGTWGIVCSQDSGANWSANSQFYNGDLPKVSVGQDGTVYVAYHPNNDDNILVRRFTSCETGLVNLGASVVAVDPAGVACPVPGLDRCNRRNSLASPLVAVDDTDPTHVYIAYAANTFPGNGGGWFGNCTNQNLCNEDIVVQDSVDGGVTWPRSVVISSGVTARRFMPWACTLGGEVHVAWYDRSIAMPGGTTVSDNSLTDFFRGSAFVDAGGNLVKGTEFQLNEPGTADAQCEAGAATGTAASWPAPPDFAVDSESCSLQPQLAGVCCAPADITGTACPTPSPSSTRTRCDFNPDTCTGGEICSDNRGSPKYGDYNGVACAEGRFYSTWASATSPPAVAPASTSIDAFFASEIVCCVPEIQVPASPNFAQVCGNDVGRATMEVCNTGKENLVVGSIGSDDPDFAVTPPLAGFPVTISPDFCFGFEVTFDPSSSGTDTAVLAVASNDPVSPSFDVPVTADAGEPRLVTVMDADYGDVCLGDKSTQQLTILNDGSCDLTIGNVSVNDADNEFAPATIMSTPFVLAGGESISVDVEFTPAGDVGGASADLVIQSDDPTTPSKSLPLSGNSPSAAINTFIANSGSFNEVCSGDIHDLGLTVQNDGACPLQIDSATIVLGVNAQAGDFVQPDGDAAGTVVAPGNSVVLPIRFSPSAFDNEPPLLRTASVDVASRTRLAASTLGTDSTPVDGVVPPPDINVAIANSGEFGDVCKEDQSDLDLTLFNQGKCDLTISDIELLPDAGSFELPADLVFPLVLSPDADFTAPIRFSPEVCFDDPEQRTVKITSDDPDEMMVNIDISGVSPCPNLVIDPAPVTGIHAFPATVVDSTGVLGCFNERSVTLRNNGGCPLTIDNVAAAGVSGDAADYAVTAPTLFPIILPSGEETLDVTLRFTPQADANPLAPDEVIGLLTVVSDDPDGDALADLCGESVAQSGVRILVTDVSSGTPVIVDRVDDITIQSKGSNRPGPINLRFTDQPASSALVCGNVIDYHVDQETLPATETTGSNPRSSYLAKAKEGNLQTSQSFGLGQCEFRDFQLQLQDSDAPICLLLPKGAACTTDGECCSGKCKGRAGSKSCK